MHAPHASKHKHSDHQRWMQTQLDVGDCVKCFVNSTVNSFGSSSDASTAGTNGGGCVFVDIALEYAFELSGYLGCSKARLARLDCINEDRAMTCIIQACKATLSGTHTTPLHTRVVEMRVPWHPGPMQEEKPCAWL